MVYGFADQEKMIDVDLVDEMVLERMKDSVVPIVNRDAAGKSNKSASKELEKDFPWIKPQGGEEAVTPETIATADEKQKIIAENIKPDEKQETVTETIEQVVAEVEEPFIERRKAVSDQENKTKQASAVNVNKSKASDRGRAKKSELISDDTSVSVEEKTKPSVIKQPDIHLDKKASSKADSIGETRKQLIKYGAIAAVFSLVLIVFAIALDDGSEIESDVTVSDENNAIFDSQDQREQEQNNAQLKQLQLEAEALKKERDAALLKIEQEKLAKEEAEIQAAAKAALAVKAAEEIRKAEESKRLADAKKRERQARQAKAKAKEESARIASERAKLEEERLVRLEEEKRLKEQEEARRLVAEVHRLELEQKKKELLELQALQDKAEQQANVDGGQSVPKKDSAECSGPTARFKSGCR